MWWICKWISKMDDGNSRLIKPKSLREYKRYKHRFWPLGHVDLQPSFQNTWNLHQQKAERRRKDKSAGPICSEWQNVKRRSTSNYESIFGVYFRKNAQRYRNELERQFWINTGFRFSKYGRNSALYQARSCFPERPCDLQAHFGFPRAALSKTVRSGAYRSILIQILLKINKKPIHKNHG